MPLTFAWFSSTIVNAKPGQVVKHKAFCNFDYLWDYVQLFNPNHAFRHQINLPSWFGTHLGQRWGLRQTFAKRSVIVHEYFSPPIPRLMFGSFKDPRVSKYECCLACSCSTSRRRWWRRWSERSCGWGWCRLALGSAGCPCTDHRSPAIDLLNIWWKSWWGLWATWLSTRKAQSQCSRVVCVYRTAL